MKIFFIILIFSFSAWSQEKQLPDTIGIKFKTTLDCHWKDFNQSYIQVKRFLQGDPSFEGVFHQAGNVEVSGIQCPWILNVDGEYITLKARCNNSGSQDYYYTQVKPFILPEPGVVNVSFTPYGMSMPIIFNCVWESHPTPDQPDLNQKEQIYQKDEVKNQVNPP